jgi:hypothetical protein
MASKPLHIKRFRKALADYRQSMNHSFTTVPLRRLSTGETLSDRNLFSSLLHPTSNNNSSKTINQISSNWGLNVSFLFSSSKSKQHASIIHLENRN